MGRFCNGLMTVFRIAQLILSLAALACGAYITYTMFSLSSTAHNVELSIAKLNTTTELQDIEITLDMKAEDVQTYLQVLDLCLTPILHFLEGTPVRAILLTAVGLWSTCVIIYLLIAQRASNPKLNKRSIRITLELLTLILWIIGIVCAGLLAAEYGALIFSGGIEVKAAWSALKPIIEEVLKALLEDDSIARELDIVNDVFDIGALSILAVISAGICGIVSFVSLIAACCISGKSKSRNVDQENGAAEYLALASTDKSSFSVLGSSSPASWGTPTPMYHSSQRYSPAPQYATPEHGYRGEEWSR